jgi:hypothetical protein
MACSHLKRAAAILTLTVSRSACAREPVRLILGKTGDNRRTEALVNTAYSWVMSCVGCIPRVNLYRGEHAGPRA